MAEEYGPLEFVVVVIPDDSAAPAVLAAVGGQLDNAGVRLLDALIIRRSRSGDVDFAELADDDLADTMLGAPGLAAEEDALHLAAALPAGQTAVLLAIESVWLKNLVGAADAAGGHVVVADRIPAAVVNAIAATS
ncbi:DUF6325 family protein [Microbacterium sp. NPDC089189]|uniref:DUF6325 family protein n=1 Tax=Microbacterium sp. NPDC089189 TaxID=3154972 RepID=UPI00341C3B9D